MRSIQFSTDGFYHVYNRGVEKRKIFLTKGDYYRFLLILYELNDATPQHHRSRRSFEVSMKQAMREDNRDCLVSVLAYCLMPNHFHLLLRPRTEDGLQRFMHRVGTSFSKYFNQRIERTGRLFESTFKAKAVMHDAYLQHLVRYIHLNPLILFDTQWKERGIQNRRTSEKFLERYTWSSYPTYIDRQKRNALLDDQVIRDVVGQRGENHKKFIFSWTSQDFQTVIPLLFDSSMVKA